MKRMLLIVLAAFYCGCGPQRLDVGSGDAGAPGLPTPASRSTVVVPRQRNLRSLVGDEFHLYWIVDEGGQSEVWRCGKRDCAGTTQSFLRWGNSDLAALQLRGETMYLIGTGSILSCPTAGCDAPNAVVARSLRPTAVAFDDANIYWAEPRDGAIFSCPLAGCDHATAAPVLDARVWELAIDGSNLYWIAPDPKVNALDPVRRTDIVFAPKDGSAAPTTLVIRPGHATSLVVRDGFVTWAMSQESGSIERCPTTGCLDGMPELVADQQSSPYFVTVDRDARIWMNGKGAAKPWSMGGTRIDGPTTVARIVKIVACDLSNCASSIEVLDESYGGDTSAGPWGWMQPQGMVVDSEAIYWIGDVVPVGPQGSQEVTVDASIRRLARGPRGAR